jgi:3-oxoacyl-[acyl-carrier-protein] synthase-3
VIDTMVHSDPSKYDLVAIPDGEHFFQHGQAVQKFAVTKTIEATQVILSRNGLSIEGTSLFFVGHQANLRMVMSACEKLAIPEQRHLFNVDQFGNQGAAGAPCTLSMYEHKIPSDSYVVVAVVGSGLTWGSALLRRC